MNEQYQEATDELELAITAIRNAIGRLEGSAARAVAATEMATLTQMAKEEG